MNWRSLEDLRAGAPTTFCPSSRLLRYSRVCVFILFYLPVQFFPALLLKQLQYFIVAFLLVFWKSCKVIETPGYSTWRCVVTLKHESVYLFSDLLVSQAFPVFILRSNPNKTGRKMVFLTCSVSFRSISWRYFPKLRLKIISGSNHPLVPSDFYDLPCRVRGYPGFF